MSRTEAHDRDRQRLRRVLAEAKTWRHEARVTADGYDAMHVDCAALRGKLAAAEGRLEEAREELVRIRDRLIDRDPPYAVAIDRVLAVLRNEQYLADSAPDKAVTGKELQEGE